MRNEVPHTNGAESNSSHLLAKTVDQEDIRDIIFREVMHKQITASLQVMEDGVIAGMACAKEAAQDIGLEVVLSSPDGSEVKKGSIIATVRGNPKQIVMAEDLLIGLIAKASGIATAARRAIHLADGKVTVVCGSWKKMPIQLKMLVRKALVLGGVQTRIIETPFLYLDKNYVRIFGGIGEALNSVSALKNKVRVIQIRGETASIEMEVIEAAEQGAGIVMVDTGNIDDLERASKILRKHRLRGKLKLAFGGSIRLEDIPILCKKDVEILDVGRAIIDASMLDIKFNVEFK
jgi:nicotinate-nucleotide pyrophosphorylase (carboxylating)